MQPYFCRSSNLTCGGSSGLVSSRNWVEVPVSVKVPGSRGLGMQALPEARACLFSHGAQGV